MRLPSGAVIGGNSPKFTFSGWKVAASAPPVIWPIRAPCAVDLDQRFGLQAHGDRLGKADAVDRQRDAGRHLVGIARGHDERAEAAHLLVQQADGVVRRVVRAERVGADQLRQAARDVRLGGAHGTHLVQDNRRTGAGDLPGRLGPGEAAADNVDGIQGRFTHANVNASCVSAMPFSA